MRGFIYLIIFLISIEISHAQMLAEGRSLSGKVVDREGNTFGGTLKYNMQNETVIIDVGGSIKTLTARNINFFEFFDDRLNFNRRFLALMYAKNPNNNYEKAVFFELLNEGSKVTLLATERLETRMNSNRMGGMGGIGTPMYSYYVVNEYFLMSNNQKVVKLQTNKRKSFLQQLGSDRAKVEIFMKQNRLGINSRVDLIKIIEYYDTL